MPGPPSRAAAFRYWLRLGCISFGGPAGQIGTLHREVVVLRQWLGEDEFGRALSFCMLLPGPEALQLVIYLGWRWHGTRGGIVAGLCFLVPAALLLTALSFVYVLYGTLAPVAAVVTGLKGVVVALIVQALYGLGRRALAFAAVGLGLWLLLVRLSECKAPGSSARHALLTLWHGLWLLKHARFATPSDLDENRAVACTPGSRQQLPGKLCTQLLGWVCTTSSKQRLRSQVGQ